MDFVGQNLSLDFILGVIRSHLRVLGSVMPRSNLFIGLFPQIKKIMVEIHITLNFHCNWFKGCLAHICSVCYHHHCLVSEIFIILKGNLVPIGTWSPFPPSSSPQAAHSSGFCLHKFAYLGISYKWNHAACVWLLSSIVMFCCSSIMEHTSIFHSFSWPSNIPIYRHTAFSISIQPWIDIWIVSTFGHCK